MSSNEDKAITNELQHSSEDIEVDKVTCGKGRTRKYLTLELGLDKTVGEQ